MAEASRRCGAGFASTCTSAGTTSTLIDLLATDEGVDESFAQGGWLFRPNAPTAADRLRRISGAGFDVATGTWTVGRAWADAPDSAEAYHVFSMLPPTNMPGIPESWQRLVNRALAATWYADEIVIGGGDGVMRTFPISDETGWVANEQHIRAVYFRTYNDNGTLSDVDQARNGRWWRVQNGANGAQVVFQQTPSETQDIVVAVIRTYAALDSITDETACPLDVAALRTRYELYCYLDAASQSAGQYKAEKERAYRDWLTEYKVHRPHGAVILA